MVVNFVLVPQLPEPDAADWWRWFKSLYLLLKKKNWKR
jgi:hypothetical protein